MAKHKKWSAGAKQIAAKKSAAQLKKSDDDMVLREATVTPEPNELFGDPRVVRPRIDSQHLVAEPIALKALFGDVTDKWKREYILAYASLGNRSRAAQQVRVSTVTTWHWMNEDSDFKAAMERADEVVANLHEDELLRRASEGVLQPVFNNGIQVGMIRRFDTAALIVALKVMKPERYRERFDVTNRIEVDIAARLREGRARALAAKNNTGE